MLDITIKRLRTELITDYLHFFDNVAFTDNPKWASCYCYYDLANCANAEWEARTGEQNREAAQAAIVSGSMQGYLAYLDGQPVGWCHADAKNCFPLYRNVPHAAEQSELAQTGAIVCFLVAPDYRGQGIGQQLLESVCAGFKKDGYKYVEGYPNKAAATAGENHHGPLEMYTNYGFAAITEIGSRVVVRKTLV